MKLAWIVKHDTEDNDFKIVFEEPDEGWFPVAIPIVYQELESNNEPSGAP